MLLIKPFFQRSGRDPESAKTPATAGGPLRFPSSQTTKPQPIDTWVAAAISASPDPRDAKVALLNIKQWTHHRRNRRNSLRHLFKVMEAPAAHPEIRAWAGEIILDVIAHDTGDDVGDTRFFPRPGDRMAALTRIKQAVPSLAPKVAQTQALKYSF